MINFDLLTELTEKAAAAQTLLHDTYLKEGFEVVQTGSWESTRYWYCHVSIKDEFDNEEWEPWQDSFEEARKARLIVECQ